jgi:hypothetical protein
LRAAAGGCRRCRSSPASILEWPAGPWSCCRGYTPPKPQNDEKHT